VTATERVDAAGRLAALERENAQLRQALDSRVVIEQAKGVLAERYGTDVDVAFELLRRGARSAQLRLHDLAAAVLASAETPPTIERERIRAGW
jgi:AmiR/NasT family two-component response regulator